VNDTGFDINIHNDYTDIQTEGPTGLDAAFGPDGFNAVILTDIIIGGGKMNFVDRGTETAPELVTLIRDAVHGTPPSLLSGMLPAVFAAEAVLVRPFRSAALALSTTVGGLSPACTASLPSLQRFGGATSTNEHGGGTTTRPKVWWRHGQAPEKLVAGRPDGEIRQRRKPHDDGATCLVSTADGICSLCPPSWARG
jgi:hypothetical protein